MNALEQSDLESDLAESAEEKLRQALVIMSSGLRFQRQTLQRQNPEADEQAIDALFMDWLLSGDDA